ncbi:hypothetical protein JSY14_09875 [Brachybacterium sp. EF45031]|nr:hypothetical protein [Brachybacterium sillae]MCS6712311.1 hypothetical protein [Brachybacterium sillae]
MTLGISAAYLAVAVATGLGVVTAVSLPHLKKQPHKPSRRRGRRPAPRR